MIVVSLPWPPKELSPNARLHWAQRRGYVKKSREWARLACLSAGACHLGWQRARVSITFRAPDRRARDIDNMLASAKSSLDGVADATGIDDRHWSIEINRGEPVKGGEVLVCLEEAA